LIELASCGCARLGCKPYPELVKSALDCLREARRKQVVVRKISVDPANNICLNMGSGLSVKLGRPLEMKLKLSKLKDILTAKPEIANEALYIDLRCVTAPVWKPKQAAALNPL
jgi:cell division septal protein FtsQ